VRAALLLPGLLVLAASACERQPPAGAEQGVVDELAFEGERACADCDAIATRLVLRRRDDRRDYALTETYRAQSGDLRFVERGRWQRQQALLRLQGEGGSRRTYAVLPDGRLQARDPRGAILPGAHDVLVPVADAGR
jgi:hypothetical protein